MRRLASRAGVGRRAVLRAVWALLLARYSDEQDVVLDDGRCVTVLPVGPAVTLAELLRAAENTVGEPRPAGAGSTVLVVEPGTGVRDAAIEVVVTDLPEVVISFDTAKFGEAALRRLAGHLGVLIDSAAAAGLDDPVTRLEMLTAEELGDVLDRWNRTEAGHVPGTVHELVEAQVARTPHATAVVDTAGAMTYARLSTLSGSLAAHLREIGVRQGDVVPIGVERNALAVVAMLAVMKAGAAFLPVEPSWPAERIRRVLATVDPAVVVVTAGLADVFGEATRAAVCRVEQVESRDDLLAPQGEPGDLAYVLFTSGSTGRPKGVAVGHEAVVNLLDWVNRTFSVGGGDQTLLVTPFAFDLSVYSIFGPLVAGGAVRVASEEEIADPDRLLAVVDSEPITVWNSAPAAAQQVEPLLPPVGSTALRLVLLSGDWVPVGLPDALRRTFRAAEVVALGGPTETTVWSNYFRIGVVDPSWTSIPYGRPIQNVRCYVLDRHLRPVPAEVPGDLYVAGTCLARGYLHDPEQTAARFVPEPFTGVPGATMYRTGDRVRFWPDGTMEFLGRADDQVKIRGFRIELGEVESVLREAPEVAHAVAHVSPAGELLAFVVTREGKRPDLGALRDSLADKLPPYMVPAAVLALDRVPMTANGKLDRARLPVPVAGRPRVRRPGEDAVTAVVEQVWREVLGVERIAPEDSFFDIGGHSLAATRMIARLRTRVKVKVPLRALMVEPTLAAFSRAVGVLVDDQVPV